MATFVPRNADDVVDDADVHDPRARVGWFVSLDDAVSGARARERRSCAHSRH
jgi:hypothetical protein